MEGLVDDLASYAEAFFRDPKTERDPPPYQLVHVWEAFLKINDWRGFDRQSNLPELLSLNAIVQWAATADYELGQFDLDVFLKLEGAYWEALTPKNEKSTLFKDLKAIIQEDKKFQTVQIPKRK